VVVPRKAKENPAVVADEGGVPAERATGVREADAGTIVPARQRERKVDAEGRP